MSKKKIDPCDAYWAKLLGQAKVSLSGASDVGLKVQLIDTLQRFFDESNCWQETIEFTVIPDMLEYPLTPLNGRILRLYAVLDQHNVPQPTVMPDISTVRFIYPYTETQPMTAMVVKTLAVPDLCYPPNIPEWLLPAHGLTILYGLLGDMMLQPGTSFSNTQLATYFTQKFRDGIAHARVAMTKMNTVGVQNWMFPQSHRVSGQKGGVSTFNVHPQLR